jgi:[Skp1-protein]-hydroxyproline N-acetylglucosaminyltransferase
MRFRDHWDEYLIRLLHDTIETTRPKNNKLVLTAYPVGYTLPNQIPNETRGTLLVPWKFDTFDTHQTNTNTNTTNTAATNTTSNGMLRQRGRLLADHHRPSQTTTTTTTTTTQQERPMAAKAIPCHLYAGGFNFAPACVLHEVPYDPTLHHLFFGEELSMAVRLFTHGYDMYAPPETVCYHLWSRSHRPTQTPAEDPHKLERRRASLAVVQKQLRGEQQQQQQQQQQQHQLGCRYGLGTVRTVAQFAERLGVDFDQQRMTRDDFENGCLTPLDFCDSTTASTSTSTSMSTSMSTTLYPEDSVEAKVAFLDTKAQQLIAFFLSGVAAPTNNNNSSSTRNE